MFHRLNKAFPEPSHQGEAVTINFQDMFIPVNSSLKRTSSFLEHVPLSDIINLEILPLEINHFRAQMNDDAVRFGTTSR